MTPESNQLTVTAVNDKPVANPQIVVVWEDWLSDPITLAGTGSRIPPAWHGRSACSTGSVPAAS